MQPEPLTTNEAEEIDRAERAVAQSRANLSRSLHRVERSSTRLLNRWNDEVKPTVTLAVVALGAVAVIGVTVALVQRSKRRHGWVGPRQSSQLGGAAKALGVWALRLAARRAAQVLVERLQPAPDGLAASGPSAAQAQ